MKKIIKSFILILCFTGLCLNVNAYNFNTEASSNAVSHNNQGIWYLKYKYYYAAIQEFKTAIYLKPNSAITASFYNNLGLTYYEIGRYDWAIESFANSININPNFFAYYKNMVNSFEKANILDSELKKLNLEIKKDKYNSRSYITRALVYTKQNKKEEAIKDYNTFLIMEPKLILRSAVENELKILNK